MTASGDLRTAARAQVLLKACRLAVTRIHGSLVGRPAGVLWDVAMEPGGRHAAVLVIGGVERWDLETLECVGRWPLRRDLFPGHLVCVGEVPAGLRFISSWNIWVGLEPGVKLTLESDTGSMGGRSGPPTREVVQIVDGETAVLVRLADGARLCELPGDMRRWCDPACRFVVAERARTMFEVFAVDAGSRTPRAVATLAVPAALVGEAHVAVDGHGRRVALVFDEAVVLGAWDRWSAARTYPVPPLRWTDLEFCADGRTLVLCAKGRVVRIDTRNGRTSETFFDVAERSQCAIDTTSGRVVHADSAGLRVIDGSGVRTRVADHGPLVTAAAANDEVLVTAGSDGSICVRDRASGGVRVQLQCPTREPHAIAVTADRVIAVGAVDGVLRWSLTGQSHPRVALPRTADPGPPRILLTPDGRHLALARRDGRREAVDVFVVDLADGRTRRLDRFELSHCRTAAHCLGLTADGARLRGATVKGFDRKIEFWSRPLAGGRREPAGASDSGGHQPLAIASDGGLLWWESIEAQEVRVSTAAAGVAGTPVARWMVGARVNACCAGRSLLAIAAGHYLLLLTSDGRSLATGLPTGSEPLAFAADERALWVRDETGLVLELAVPAWLTTPGAGPGTPAS
mgnify:CR=1 FL=1